MPFCLSRFHATLSKHGLDPEIIALIFKQIFYFICAGALNNLLLRKDMCHWSKGMQIRFVQQKLGAEWAWAPARRPGPSFKFVERKAPAKTANFLLGSMGLHQRQVALLVPNDSLLCFALGHNIFFIIYTSHLSYVLSSAIYRLVCVCLRPIVSLGKFENHS